MPCERRLGRRGPRGATVVGIRAGALQREPETERARHAPCSHPREPASRRPPRRRGIHGAQPAGAAWWTASCGELWRRALRTRAWRMIGQTRRIFFRRATGTTDVLTFSDRTNGESVCASRPKRRSTRTRDAPTSRSSCPLLPRASWRLPSPARPAPARWRAASPWARPRWGWARPRGT